MFDFGTIVLIPFPFTDLTSAKLRPAVILSNPTETEDIIVAFVSSKRHLHGLFLSDDSAQFAATGLKVSSTLRFDKLATLSKKIVLGQLGVLDPVFLRQHRQAFFDQFGF